MEEAPDCSALPPLVKAIVNPWLSAVRAATLAGGDALRIDAANAEMGLQRRLVITADIESAIVDARRATDDLATVLSHRNGSPAEARQVAIKALARLIEALRDVRPNEGTTKLGIGW